MLVPCLVEKALFAYLDYSADSLMLLAVRLLLLFMLMLGARAQTTTAGSGSSLADFSVSVQSVLVDVSVSTIDGSPVSNLRKEDFVIYEGSTPQIITFFEEHRAAMDGTGRAERQASAEPSNVFSNATTGAAPDAVSVLLLDSINTPLQDQVYMRSQVVKCLESLQPQTHVAIFTMSTTLNLVQGFTNDSSQLLSALNGGKVWPGTQASPLLKTSGEGGAEQQTIAQQEALQAEHQSEQTRASIDALRQFQGQWDAFLLDQRVNYTLANLRQLGRYLAAFPGRKNVIWFSGSFPLSTNSFGSQSDWSRRYEEDVHKTAEMLSAARVALYPIDARGLVPDPFYSDASALPQNKTESPSELQRRNQIEGSIKRNAENATMEEWARQTGGRAFFNGNGLAEAAADVIDHGARYYTLTYTPTNKRMDGTFRSIRVKIRHGGHTLSYRRGYYAVDDRTRMMPSSARPADLLRNYVKPGMPNLDQITYEMRVQPVQAQTGIQSQHAGDNPSVKGALSRCALRFAIRTDHLRLNPGGDGLRIGSLELLVIAYDLDGVPLNWLARDLALTIRPEKYASAKQNGIPVSMDIDLPANSVYLATGLLDTGSMKVGTLQIPVTAIVTLH